MTLRQRRAWWGAVVALTLLGGALRAVGMSSQPVWLDEAFSLWVARLPLAEMWAWVGRVDHHPPLYYALLHGWVAAWGDGPTALRSLSALASTLALPLVADTARRLIGPGAALLATLLLAVAPFQVRYAQEARMYALLTLAVAVTLWCAVRALTQPGSRVAAWGWWAGLALGQAAAMLTHNTTAALLPLTLNVAVGAMAVAQRRHAGGCRWVYGAQLGAGFARAWLVTQAVALALWLPWAGAFIRQAAAVDAGFWIDAPTAAGVGRALVAWTVGPLPDWWLWAEVLGLAEVLSLAEVLGLAAVGLAAWGLAQHARQAPTGWWLLLLAALPPLVTLAVSLRRPIFYDRTLIWVMLPLGMGLAQGAWAVRSMAARLMLIGGVMTLSGAGLYSYYAEFAKEPWDQVAAAVAAQAAPGDGALFHASWGQLPFDYHYPAAGPTLIRRGAPVTLFDAGEIEPPMTPAAAVAAQGWAAQQAQVWVIYAHWWYTDPDGLLPAALAQEMRLVATQEWPGIRLLRYAPR